MLNVGPKQAINNFYEILYGAVNKFFAETLIKVNKINSPLNPWMTPGLLTSRKHEERLNSKKLRSPTINNLIIKLTISSNERLIKIILMNSLANFQLICYTDPVRLLLAPPPRRLLEGESECELHLRLARLGRKRIPTH